MQRWRFRDRRSPLGDRSDGANTWSETFIDPTTGRQRSVDNPTVAADTIVDLCRRHRVNCTRSSWARPRPAATPPPGRSFGSTTSNRADRSACLGQADGFRAVGWNNRVQQPGPLEFFREPAGCKSKRFSFRRDPRDRAVLGFGTSDSWFTYVSGHDFMGPSADHTFGDAGAALRYRRPLENDLFSVADGHPQGGGDGSEAGGRPTPRDDGVGLCRVGRCGMASGVISSLYPGDRVGVRGQTR